MKKTEVSCLMAAGILLFTLSLISFTVSAQEVTKNQTTIPDSVNVILTASCTPCHTSDGGLMSRAKFNLTVWASYTPEKQKERAAKMYIEVNKGAMPPKSVREKNPERIPTKEQIQILKNWSESFPRDSI